MSSKRCMTRLLVLTMVLSMALSPIAGQQDVTAAAGGNDSSDLSSWGVEQSQAALQEIYSNYSNGTAVDGGYGNFGGFELYVLTEAGVNTDAWVYKGETLTERVEDLIDATVENSSTVSVKRIAQDYIGALTLGEQDDAETLLDILEAKQTAIGTGGLEEGDYAIYSELPAYDILCRTETVTESALNIDLAVTYLMNNQNSENGGWPSGYQDFQSTAQAVRILNYLKDYSSVDIETIEEAVDLGVEWVAGKIQEDGSYTASAYDDTLVDTSEVMICAGLMSANGYGVDKFSDLKSTTPAIYMNGSWETIFTASTGNNVSAIWALDAYNIGHDELKINLSASSYIGTELSLSDVDLTEIEVVTAAAYRITLTDRDNITETAEWTSSDQSVAVISTTSPALSIAARGEGTTTIAVSSDDQRASAELTVTSIEGNLKAEAIRGAYDAFVSGSPVSGMQDAFTSYDVGILIQNGVDVDSWLYKGESLLDGAQALIDATVSANGTGYSAKRIAQDYYLASVLKQTENQAALISILENRQNDDGSLDGGDYGIYSDFPAYDLLISADGLVTSSLDMDKALSYVMGLQGTEGAWPSAWPDFMSTAQGMRILKGLRDYTSESNTVIDNAIDNGLTWLLEQQKEDGGFSASVWDDKLVDTSEVINTAVVTGIAKEQLLSSSDKSPVDFLSDHSYDELLSMSSGNVTSIIWLLDAVVQAGNVNSNSNTSSGNSSSSSSDTSIKVYVAVLNADGEAVYGPMRVTIDEDDTYGLTAMSALDATGLDWAFSAEYDDFVVEIEGLKNVGFNGWMYAVNNTSPNVLSTEKTVDSGDEILWWYSTDYTAGIPDWPSSSTSSSSPSSTSGSDDGTEKVRDTLTDYAKSVPGTSGETAFLNEDKRMTDDEAAVLKEVLSANNVQLAKGFFGEAVAVGDDEVAVLIPENALTEKATITAEELEDNENPKGYGVSLQGSVYDFGPNGTVFEEPVTISIKVAIDSTTDISTLSPAWYDETQGIWVPIPGVVDLENGMVTFTTDHFTKFAVIQQEKRISFDDVDDSYSWAKDAIEILAGKGYIRGTGTGYEPGRELTRAEFAKIMTMALGYEVSVVEESTFNDVAADSYFASYIETAYTNGLLLGNPDGTFGPEDVISRNELATVLGRLADRSTVPGEYTLNFADSTSIPEWAIDGIRFSAYSGIIKGDDQGMFRGEASLTRAEGAVAIYRYLTYTLD